jgi:hypothetical protein
VFGRSGRAKRDLPTQRRRPPLTHPLRLLTCAVVARVETRRFWHLRSLVGAATPSARVAANRFEQTSYQEPDTGHTRAVLHVSPLS